jgi:hypothetical protein
MLHLARDSIESLVPVTTEMLAKMVHSTFRSATNESFLLSDLDNMTQSWMRGPLKDSVILTDSSRKVAHWKDGDQNNKTIRDPKCDGLAQKLQKAIDPTQLQPYYNFLMQAPATDQGRDNPIEVIKATSNVMGLMAQNVPELGGVLVKHVNTAATKCITDSSKQQPKILFPQMYQLLVQTYQTHMLQIVTNAPAQIGYNWFIQQILVPHAQSLNVCLRTGNKLVFRTSGKEIPAEQFLDLVKECITEHHKGDLVMELFLHLIGLCKQQVNTAAFLPCLDLQQIRENVGHLDRWLKFDRVLSTPEDIEFVVQYESQLLEFVYKVATVEI